MFIFLIVVFLVEEWVSESLRVYMNSSEKRINFKVVLMKVVVMT